MLGTNSKYVMRKAIGNHGDREQNEVKYGGLLNRKRIRNGAFKGRKKEHDEMGAMGQGVEE